MTHIAHLKNAPIQKLNIQYCTDSTEHWDFGPKQYFSAKYSSKNKSNLQHWLVKWMKTNMFSPEHSSLKLDTD